jgi:hypothetical protein
MLLNDRERDSDRCDYRDRNYGTDRTRDNGYTRPRNTGGSNGNHDNENHGARKRCAPLTQNERDLLNEHKGCTRCRKFYVDPDHERERREDWVVTEDDIL